MSVDGSLGWRTFLVFAIFAGGIIGLSNGVVLSDGGDLSSITAILFCVFCQFLLAGSEFGIPVSGPQWALSLMWFVYFAAPLSTVILGAERLVQIIEKENWKVSSFKNHYVIFGYDAISASYLRRLRSKDQKSRIILVDDRLEPPQKRDLVNRFSLIAIDGTASLQTLSENLRLQFAKKVCIFQDADFDAFDSATLILQKWPELEGKIIVQSGDLRFVRSLKNSDLSRRCVLFNSYNLAASVLVSSALIAHFKESPETDLVVIAGYGRFGQSMLALLHEKASSSVRQVVIIDQDAETQVSIAKEEEQSIEDFVVTVITGDVTHPTVWSEVAVQANLSLGSPTIVLATGNAKANLNTAITLKNRYPNASLFTRTQEPNLFVDQVARDEGLNAFSIDSLVENGLPQRWM